MVKALLITTDTVQGQAYLFSGYRLTWDLYSNSSRLSPSKGDLSTPICPQKMGAKVAVFRFPLTHSAHLFQEMIVQ